jgi:diaminopimelate decarboxylase
MSRASPAWTSYASKAWCTVGLLQLVDDEGLLLDVASGGELHTALVAGVDPAKLIFHGNNKSSAELEQALEVGVGRIVCDSFDELDRLERLAAARDVVARLLAADHPGHRRAHPRVRTHGSRRLRSSGSPCRSGSPTRPSCTPATSHTSRSSASTPTSAPRSSGPIRSSPTPR